MAKSATATAAKMDYIYRYQRFIYDVTRRYYLLGRDRLIAGLNVPPGGSMLEVGCGTARNLIHAARRYPTAQAHGFDVSEEMLRTACASVEHAGMSAQIQLTAADATAFDIAELSSVPVFDRVFISYALSMIPAWRDVIACSAACIAPGGAVHIVDFGDFARYPAWVGRMQRAWLRRFSVVPIPNFEDELIILAKQLALEPVVTQLYGGYAVLACLKRN